MTELIIEATGIICVLFVIYKWDKSMETANHD